MKPLLLFLLPCLLMFCAQNSSAQANTDLSNLVSPTKANANLLPETDNSKNLGSTGKSWKNLYLEGHLYLDDQIFVTNGSGLQNTFVGISAGNSNSNGSNNAMLGYQAGYSNTFGSSNSFFGSHAGYFSNAHDNSFFGGYAGYNNTTGDGNSFFGENTGYHNTTGYYNSFFGQDAGKYNLTGHYNSFFGWRAGLNNTTGNDNSFLGQSAGFANTTGSANSYFGTNAGVLNNTGNNNSFFGYSAGYNNTGLENSFFGKAAGYSNTTGVYNSFFGKDAGYNSTGNNNSFFGKHSGYANTNADGNTFIGNDAGDLVTIGDNNTALGFSSDIEGTSYTNSTALGYNCSATASNQARIGNSFVTSIGGYASWTNLSDGRYKKNVKENVPGLSFIAHLRPVTYTMDVSGINQFITSMNEDADDPATQKAIRDKEQIVYTGFIAQEVESAAKELGYDFSGVDAPKNEKDLYGLRYAEFVVPLVKAVQELDLENARLLDGQGKLKVENGELKSAVETLKSDNESLQFAVGNLQKEMADLKSQLSHNTLSERSEGAEKPETALLGQNIPNPFDNSTVIPFRIPCLTGRQAKDCNDASVVISESATGKIVRVIPVACGETQLALEGGLLASGTYSYSLIVDGKIIDAKQMVLTK